MTWERTTYPVMMITGWDVFLGKPIRKSTYCCGCCGENKIRLFLNRLKSIFIPPTKLLIANILSLAAHGENGETEILLGRFRPDLKLFVAQRESMTCGVEVMRQAGPPSSNNCSHSRRKSAFCTRSHHNASPASSCIARPFGKQGILRWASPAWGSFAPDSAIFLQYLLNLTIPNRR